MKPSSSLVFAPRVNLMLKLKLKPLQSACLTSHPYLSASHTRALHTTRTTKLHSTQRPEAVAPTLIQPDFQHGIPDLAAASASTSTSTSDKPSPPLSKLPMATLVRSILLQQATSMPIFLKPSIAVLSYFATAKSALLSPDRNPLLKHVLKPLLYNHFCAGENAQQVSATTDALKRWGVRGIFLCWAREVEFRRQEGVDLTQQLQDQLAIPGAITAAEQVIREWGQGCLKTVKIAASGDFVSLKFSGAGPIVLSALLNPKTAHHELFDFYLHEVCKLAKSRGVSLAVDAEQQRFQPGIDAVTISLARQYNGNTPGSAVILNTYQCYLKSSPTKLSADLKLAASEGWTLGAKIVRGAYLGSESRDVIWDTKEGTDAAFDGVAEGLMRRSWSAGGYLKGSGDFPNVDVVLATHNLVSVQKAVAIRQEQADLGQERIKLVYAQLMGMADHVSAAAIEAGQEAEARAVQRFGTPSSVEVPKVYKYLVWGSVQECMRYLVRRAEENRDAASRTKESGAVLWAELKRRALRQ